MRKIVVTISGAPKSGKSHLAAAIAEAIGKMAANSRIHVPDECLRILGEDHVPILDLLDIEIQEVITRRRLPEKR